MMRARVWLHCWLLCFGCAAAQSQTAEPETIAPSVGAQVSGSAARIGAAGSASAKPAFTAAEQRWIAANPMMRLGADPAYPPYSTVNREGVFEGLAAEYVRLASERSGLKFQLQPHLTWPEILDGARAGRIDVIAAAADTPARRVYLRFTHPYMNFPTALITRVDGPYVSGLAGLAGRRLAVVRGFSINELILREHPQITLVQTGSLAESLDAVAERRADAMVGNLESAGRMLTERHLGTLKVSATVPESPNTLSFAVRTALPELQSILDKTLATITPAEHDAIRQRWLTVRFEEGISLQKLLVRAAPFGLALLAIIIVILFWNRRLQRQVALTKQAENQIAYQLSLQTALIDTIPHPVFYKDGQGRYLGINRAYEQAFGVARAALLGKTSLEAPHLSPVLRNSVHLSDMELIATRSRRSRESRVMYVDGTPHHLISTGTVFSLPGAPPGGMIGTLTDISELKTHEYELAEARDRALDATRAKSSFLAAMSHEIRTPMNGIIGVLELLDDSALVPQQRQAVMVAHDSAQSLLALLNDILDFSKIEAGRMELDPAPARLAEVLGTAAAVFDPLIRAKDLSFQVDLPLGTEVWHRCDALRIKQIIFNLLSNAIKFTASGSISLTLRTTPAEAGSQVIEIEVRDSGIGITPAQMARLFVPFNQAENSTSAHFGGTGLGLSISRRFAELMGGSLTLESGSATSVGSSSGTTALFRAPFALTTAPTDQSTDAQGRAGLAAAVRGLKVLAADDHPANRYVVAGQLTRLGCHATIVEDGLAALTAWRAARDEGAPYDFILLDGNMPVLDGFETARRIRKEENSASTGGAGSGGNTAAVKSVRIFALTADARAEAHAQCLAAGMDGVLVKPVNLSSLGNALACQLPLAVATASSGPSILSASAETALRSGYARFEQNIGNPAEARQLAQLFFESTEVDIAALHDSSLTLKQLGSTAHRIKGAALTMHAEALGRAAAALEQALANSENTGTGAPATDRQRASNMRLAEAIEQEFSALRSACAAMLTQQH